MSIKTRILAGLFCGAVSAGLTTWFTDSGEIVAAVGILVATFVILFGDLLLVIWDD